MWPELFGSLPNLFLLSTAVSFAVPVPVLAPPGLLASSEFVERIFARCLLNRRGDQRRARQQPAPLRQRSPLMMLPHGSPSDSFWFWGTKSLIVDLGRVQSWGANYAICRGAGAV